MKARTNRRARTGTGRGRRPRASTAASSSRAGAEEGAFRDSGRGQEQQEGGGTASSSQAQGPRNDAGGPASSSLPLEPPSPSSPSSRREHERHESSLFSSEDESFSPNMNNQQGATILWPRSLSDPPLGSGSSLDRQQVFATSGGPLQEAAVQGTSTLAGGAEQHTMSSGEDSQSRVSRGRSTEHEDHSDGSRRRIRKHNSQLRGSSSESSFEGPRASRTRHTPMPAQQSPVASFSSAATPGMVAQQDEDDGAMQSTTSFDPAGSTTMVQFAQEIMPLHDLQDGALSSSASGEASSVVPADHMESANPPPTARISHTASPVQLPASTSAAAPGGTTTTSSAQRQASQQAQEKPREQGAVSKGFIRIDNIVDLDNLYNRVDSALDMESASGNDGATNNLDAVFSSSGGEQQRAGATGGRTTAGRDHGEDDHTMSREDEATSDADLDLAEVGNDESTTSNTEDFEQQHLSVAVDRETGQLVVLKLVEASASKRRALTAMLNLPPHPNVVPINRVYEDVENHWFVMEMPYIRGGTLLTWLSRQRVAAARTRGLVPRTAVAVHHPIGSVSASAGGAGVSATLGGGGVELRTSSSPTSCHMEDVLAQQQVVEQQHQQQTPVVLDQDLSRAVHPQVVLGPSSTTTTSCTGLSPATSPSRPPVRAQAASSSLAGAAAPGTVPQALYMLQRGLPAPHWTPTRQLQQSRSPPPGADAQRRQTVGVPGGTSTSTAHSRSRTPYWGLGGGHHHFISAAVASSPTATYPPSASSLAAASASRLQVRSAPGAAYSVRHSQHPNMLRTAVTTRTSATSPALVATTPGSTFVLPQADAPSPDMSTAGTMCAAGCSSCGPRQLAMCGLRGGGAPANVRRTLPVFRRGHESRSPIRQLDRSPLPPAYRAALPTAVPLHGPSPPGHQVGGSSVLDPVQPPPAPMQHRPLHPMTRPTLVTPSAAQPLVSVPHQQPVWATSPSPGPGSSISAAAPLASSVASSVPLVPHGSGASSTTQELHTTPLLSAVNTMDATSTVPMFVDSGGGGGSASSSTCPQSLPNNMHEEKRRIMKGVLSAVQHMHENGLVHTDVKLQNFVLDVDEETGSVKEAMLIDFEFVTPYEALAYWEKRGRIQSVLQGLRTYHNMHHPQQPFSVDEDDPVRTRTTLHQPPRQTQPPNIIAAAMRTRMQPGPAAGAASSSLSARHASAGAAAPAATGGANTIASSLQSAPVGSRHAQQAPQTSALAVVGGEGVLSQNRSTWQQHVPPPPPGPSDIGSHIAQGHITRPFTRTTILNNPAAVGSVPSTTLLATATTAAVQQVIHAASAARTSNATYFLHPTLFPVLPADRDRRIPGVTPTATIQGTAEYLAPEMMVSERRVISPLNDLWAVGIIFFHLETTNYWPWSRKWRENIKATCSARSRTDCTEEGLRRLFHELSWEWYNLLRDDPEVDRRLARFIPDPDSRHLCRKLLHFDEHQRLSSAKEALRLLERLDSKGSST
ncbi:unnamed protein product [Amoebophrya sp. A120]|nr:unnamed protein product [Amoebophrya sp. A120]|eukprot:GSA120T00002134001.1